MNETEARELVKDFAATITQPQLLFCIACMPERQAGLFLEAARVFEATSGLDHAERLQQLAAFREHALTVVSPDSDRFELN